jgi:integrase
MIVNLNTMDLDRLTCPEGKRRVEYVDKGGTGLYVEVRATSPGQGTYYLRYKDMNGKTCHQKIGRTDDLDLDAARSKARKLKAEITLGKDPRAEDRARKAVLTLDDFFKDHYLPHAKVHKRTWKKDSELYDLRLKRVFGSTRLDRIRRHEIQSFHVALKNDGLSPAYADHFVKLLRHALNLAVEWEMLERNPASRVHLFNADNRVEHYLDDDQLERLLTVLKMDTERNHTARMVALFLLSTGARLNEALRAKWQEVDRDNRVWRIPAATSKSKKVRSVPLNASALEVLDRLDTEDDSEWLFVNRRTGKPLTTIHKVWERLRKKAGLPHLRIHDLRHMYASFLVNSGRTLYEVQQILGHRDPVVTQRYAHLSSRALRDAADAASTAIDGASGGSA